MSTSNAIHKKARKKSPKFPCTDAGNAEMFATCYGKGVRYDHKQQRWLFWIEKRRRWVEDKQGKVRVLMKQTARQRFKMAASIPGDSDTAIAKRKRQAAWAINSEDRYRIDAALELAKSEAPISDPGDGWNADPWLLGVTNGVVDLHTGKLREATQQDRITKFSPVAFDPDAKCPRFEQFLGEIFKDKPEMPPFIQRAAGYSLTGSIEEHCLFALYGAGRNGKSTLLEVLLHLMGDYGVDLPFSHLEVKHYPVGEGVNLPGARFAKSVETRRGRQLDEARIKAWTGGDTISVRPLYRNAFQFKPTHKHWIAFNDKPEIADDSPALWSRIHLVLFEQKFIGQAANKKLLAELLEEAPGILRWAIAGCLAWRKGGLKPPKAVEDATSEYQAESDPLASFFEDCCELDPAYSVSKGDLLEAYEKWCKASRERPMSRNDFYQAMKSRGFGEGRTGHARYWTGLRLRPNDTSDITQACFHKLPIESGYREKLWKGRSVASPASYGSELPPLTEFAEPVED